MCWCCCSPVWHLHSTGAEEQVPPRVEVRRHAADAGPALTPECCGKIPPAMADHQSAGADARPPRCGGIAGWRPERGCTPKPSAAPAPARSPTERGPLGCGSLQRSGRGWRPQEPQPPIAPSASTFRCRSHAPAPPPELPTGASLPSSRAMVPTSGCGCILWRRGKSAAARDLARRDRRRIGRTGRPRERTADGGHKEEARGANAPGISCGPSNSRCAQPNTNASRRVTAWRWAAASFIPSLCR
jgi:hypothetical protein